MLQVNENTKYKNRGACYNDGIEKVGYTEEEETFLLDANGSSTCVSHLLCATASHVKPIQGYRVKHGLHNLLMMLIIGHSCHTSVSD